MTDQDLLGTYRPLSDEAKAAMRGRLTHAMAAGAEARWGPRRSVLTFAGLAAAVTVAILLTSLATSSSPAWAASPTAVSASTTSSAAKACQTQLSTVPRYAGQPPAASGSVVIGEQRGSTTSVFMADGRTAGICIGTTHSQFAGIMPLVEHPTAPLAVDNAQAGGSGAPGEAGARLAFGRVASVVASVQVRTSDGRDVVASVEGGYFFAWWPSDADAVTITAYDGRQHQVAQEHPASAHVPAQQSPGA